MLLYFRRMTLDKTEVMRKVETSAATELTGVALGSPSRSKATCAARARSRARWSGRPAPAIFAVDPGVPETDKDAEWDLKARRRSEVVASEGRFALSAVVGGSGAVGVRGLG